MVDLRFNLLNLFFAVLVAVVIFLQYRLWFESGGILDYLHLKKQLSTQTSLNEQLRKRNEELLFQVKHLQNDQDATESRARHDLGMIKKDEVFYQIVKQD
ncbi:MAG: hypothetical protein A3F12_08020 [Gammaproteobacteria bacterium RIFCSPHIGHO2_12_FULL_38_14]|nr:MAG: hypothetical protein A3F12_08020 [Gammaproteobacteria bacterium RIFCSPHIGHO2_12_FULL_38_14]